jgi:ATP-dependent helicase/nuclease subunit A
MDSPLNPDKCIVVEACAGSGKTWLLVSRIVRLLLCGVKPGEILAITFTRKAAQEMQARLRDWLYDLASRDDDFVRDFLHQRGVTDIEDAMPRARLLYQQLLLSRPSVTINTFHGWFMQILQKAPLNNAGGVQLVEKTAQLWQETWQIFLDGLHKKPDSDVAQSMMFLFREIGLSNTKLLLNNFCSKRCEWWAYTTGQNALAFALENLHDELNVEMSSDPVADLFETVHFTDQVHELSQQLNASAAQQAKGARLLAALDQALLAKHKFTLLWDELYTQKNEPRVIKANKGQDGEQLAQAVESVRNALLDVFNKRHNQKIYQSNCHALRSGVALLTHYQTLKQRQQLLDFSDIEWRVSQLLDDSDHAEYLQYKLDSRYRHVLLDEFQDTNPLQWQILQSWFAASKAADNTPVVFVVGDPKQSIYRFRRADARLFDVVRHFLQEQYGARHLKNNQTRRNSPAVLAVVNGVFDGLAEYQGFEKHDSHQHFLPGYVDVLPLAIQGIQENSVETGSLQLRNPLLTAYPGECAGAREIEALQFAAKIIEITGHWEIQDEGHTRPLMFSDIMVLVRRRTHLEIYEHALRQHSIPYLTSRRGGLLNTLESSDIQSLLGFLITPFADLLLAHTLRTPIFSCSDHDLMLLSGEDNTSSWWQRLIRLVQTERATPALTHAHRLLQNWMLLADTLPVHDLLDRIYFEGDALARYAAATPEIMRETVYANLQAFLEMALNVDAGRYPSLPGFLRELNELHRADDNESPNEGKISNAGNALRIYTVHEAKGLEAPVVWMLDTNAKPPANKGYDALIDWPTNARSPVHFSLYEDKASRGQAREHYFAQEAQLALREDLNLLYVAMTRAKQALLVSGNGAQLTGMWYQRIKDATNVPIENPLVSVAAGVKPSLPAIHPTTAIDKDLCQPFPVGVKRPTMNDAQRYGVWLHGLMQYLAPDSNSPPLPDANHAMRLKDELQLKLNIPAVHMDKLWPQALNLLNMPTLLRFFDKQYYLSAANELCYVNAIGQLRRIDRMVEFKDEVWVLDYKSGDNLVLPSYMAQLEEYRSAMQAIYPGKMVRCALIDADGKLFQF